jgi:hypothetical protein
MKRHLHAVPTAPEALDVVPDIYAAMRTEIMRKDWAAMHIEADKRKAWRRA